MANVQVNGGFVPYSPGGGAIPPNYVMRPVQIAYNNSNKIFKGDPVKNLSTGFIDAWTAGTDVQLLGGIFWGCEFLSTIRGYTVSPFWPAAGDVASTSKVTAYIYPCDSGVPMWFLAQADATGIVQADVNANVDVTMGTGNTTTGLSAALLNATSTINTTNTLPFRIVRLYSDLGGIDNGSQSGGFNKVFVAANIARTAGV